MLLRAQKFFDVGQSTRLSQSEQNWQNRLASPETYFNYATLMLPASEKRSMLAKYIAENPDTSASVVVTTVKYYTGTGKTNHSYAGKASALLEDFCYQFSKTAGMGSLLENATAFFTLLEKLFPLYEEYKGKSHDVQNAIDYIFTESTGYSAWDLTASKLQEMKKALLALAKEPEEQKQRVEMKKPGQ